MSTTETVNGSQVPEAFDEVADRYDLMVGLNPGYHAHLRASAQVLVDSLTAASDHGAGGGGAETGTPTPGAVTVVDIGCGSGASTRALVQTLDAAGLSYRLIGVDGSAGMLREARAKTWPANVSFAQGRAEHLTDLPELDCVELDAVFAAYLVRNVQQRDELFTALLGLLRPGGALVVHEYSVAGNRGATAVWSVVCWGVVVPLGWITSRRTRLYRYLWRSVMDMDSVPALRTRLRDAGFHRVRSHTIGGWQRGIIHTFQARRPERS